jgi:hypothetical protein
VQVHLADVTGQVGDGPAGQLGTAAPRSAGTTARRRAKSAARQSRNREYSMARISAAKRPCELRLIH